MSATKKKRRCPVKRQVFGLTVLLFVLGAVLANAQSSTSLMSNIPFGFIVGDVALPAGEYIIQRYNSSTTLLLTDRKSHTLYIPVMSVAKAVGVGNDKLVFHQVNGQYFLASIWTSDNYIGGVLFPPRHEREMLAQGGQPVVTELKARAR
jgi:hypothetical protein